MILTLVAVLSLETVRAFTLVATYHISTLGAVLTRLVHATNITICRETLKEKSEALNDMQMQLISETVRKGIKLAVRIRIKVGFELTTVKEKLKSLKFKLKN